MFLITKCTLRRSTLSHDKNTSETTLNDSHLQFVLLMNTKSSQDNKLLSCIYWHYYFWLIIRLIYTTKNTNNTKKIVWFIIDVIIYLIVYDYVRDKLTCYTKIEYATTKYFS